MSLPDRSVQSHPHTAFSASNSNASEQQSLFEQIQQKTTPDIILSEITRHVMAGRTLSWFQAIIPELRPGVEGDAEWLSRARMMLWNEEHVEKHKYLSTKKERLSKALPVLPDKTFGLRRFWSEIIETLLPVSHRMATAFDRVSVILARRDCLLLTPDGEWKNDLPKSSPPAHLFIVLRQALQDKVLSPIIESIKAELRNADSQVSHSPKHNPCMIRKDKNPDIQQNTKSTHHDDLLEELRDGLENLRRIVIDEKDEHELAGGTKRSASVEQDLLAKRLKK